MSLCEIEYDVVGNIGRTMDKVIKEYHLTNGTNRECTKARHRFGIVSMLTAKIHYRSAVTERFDKNLFGGFKPIH